MGAYSEDAIDWETKCRLHDAEVVAYWQGIYFSPVKTVVRVTKENALIEKAGLIAAAREMVMSDEVKELHKVQALKKTLCPDVVTEAQFWRKVMGRNTPRPGAMPELDLAKTVALLHVLAVEVECEIKLFQHRKKK